MKPIFTFVPFVIGAAFIWNKSSAPLYHPPLAKQNKPKSDLNTPFDHYNHQRTYPLNVFDHTAYDNIMQEAKAFNANHAIRSGWAWDVAGPLNINGRVNAIAINPSNTNEMYSGTAFGGIFKTTNGGSTWMPIFDDQPNLPIGALAIDPNTTTTVWAGTGDNNISGTCYTGGGIYMSTDAGSTWTHKGLANTFIVSKIIVDPTNSNTIYAATMGSPFTASTNRGLYKTTNGGTTWSQLLFINDTTGVIDLIMDPNDENTLYAASFTRMRTSERSTYHSTQCKIYKTTNGGTSWTTLSGGLPTGDIGRIGLAISATNSNVLYAIIASASSSVEGVYKSTDGGTTWITKNSTDLETFGTCYSSFGWYFGKIHVNPANDNIIYVYGVDKFISYDGGDSWTLFAPDWSTYEVHADGHDLAFIDDNSIVLATDGGLYKTDNNGTSWTDIDNMPTTQFYRVTHMPMSDQTFYGGAQDNGTIGGNKFNSPSWAWVWGGDGFKFYANPLDTMLQYYATQYGGIYYNDWGSYGTLNAGFTGSERFNWDTPYMLDRFDPSIIYLGTESMHMMTGAPYGFFTPISSDLTDGPVLPLYDGNTITTIDQNYFNQNTLYAGTSDAHVWVTTSGGSTWTDVSTGLPNRYVTSVAASPNTTGNVYVTFSGYRIDDNSPHIFKSTNNGATWTGIQGDLPNFAINDVLILPGDENHIIVGTDAGVYHTIDGGISWEPLGTGMPMVAVSELELNADKTILAAATFGRGIQVLDMSTVLSNTSHDAKATFTIFPNPTANTLTIELIQTTPLDAVDIFSLSGQKMVHAKLHGKSTQIDLQLLPKGTYLVNITGTKWNKTFVKN